MKKLLALMLALCMIVGLAACGQQAAAPAAAPAASADNLVGVAMPTKDLQRWNQDGENMKAKLEAAGYAVDLQYGANDIPTQVSQIENMIANGCKVLVIASIDGDSLGTVLAQAKEKNIPVIAYDRLIMNSDAVSYYATFDNWLVGTTQGEFIEKALGLKEGKGPFNIEFITGDPGDNNINFFFDGAMSILQPYLDNGQLVCPSGQTEKIAVATQNWATDAAQARFETILGTYYADGTQLDAVLASNDSTALGVENALEKSYTGKYPVITGQDCDIAIMKNLVEGKQAMSVFKDTRTLAAKVVEMVDALMKGAEPPVNDTKTYDNGTGVIPSFLCEPVAGTADNYVELLIDSGYYTFEQLGITPPAGAAAAPAVPAGEEVTLTLWSIATESDSSHQAFIDAIAAFEAAHPGVKIEHVTTENEAYKTKIKAAMSSGEGLPDIFFTWGMGFLGEFVNAGRVYCVDKEYEAYKAELPEAMTVNVRYDNKMYGVPYTMSLITLYANMDMLAEVGYTDIPATYEDMMACCDKLVAAGKIPFGVAGKEKWCLSEYVEPLVIKSVGGQKLRDMYNGVASWNDPGVIAAIEAFQGMIDKGYFDPSANALSNDEVKNNFIAGKTAFYQNGSWNNKDIGEQAQFAVKAGTFPVLNDSIPLYSMIGGPNNTLAVTESCEHKDLAVAAAFELAKFMSDADYKSGANLPCWAADPNAEVNDLIQAAADMASKAADMVLFGDNFLTADAANTYLDYIEMAWAGDVTPQEYVDGLDAELG